MSAELIDWLHLSQHELKESGEQNFRCLDEYVHIRSPYLNLKVTHDVVNLVLVSGPHRETYPYCLSEVFLPSKAGIVALTQSPFIIPLINSLDDHLQRSPPTNLTSYKGFTDRLTVCQLIIEYFALKGRYGLSGVTVDDVCNLLKDIEKGWFNALRIQERFDKLVNIEAQSWLTKATAKNPNRLNFNLRLFSEIVGTSLFKKTINDIPPSIIDKLNLQEDLRTPYKYSGRVERICSKNDLVITRQYISELFVALALPFRVPEISSKKKSATDNQRTKTPTVDSVTAFTEQLMSVVKNGRTLASFFSEINKILENTVPGDVRAKLISETIARWESISMFGCSYRITAIRQIRGDRNVDETTVGEAYKVYQSAVGYLTLLFTGWRLREVTDSLIGLTAEHVQYTPEDGLTLINRNVQKSAADQYERQLTAVGPHIGFWLSQLHSNNKLFAGNYSDSSSLFRIKLNGTGGGSSMFPDLSSNKRDSNPLRHFISQKTEVPTPKQLRRYFAVIYFYQFDNAEIMALTQHYGHSSPEETEVYITDTPTRNATSSINKSIPIKNVSTSTDSEFNKLFKEARDAKLRDMVCCALTGSSSAGFSKTVRAIYRKVIGGISFEELDDKAKSNAISKVYKQVKSEGYSVEVYPHGNCTNSNEHANSSEANCGNEYGQMEREHASAKLCSGCMFHEVQAQHVENLKAELATLKNTSDDIDDIFACSKTPLQLAQSNKHIVELEAVIELYEKEEYSS